jgi:hypothetical protein
VIAHSPHVLELLVSLVVSTTVALSAVGPEHRPGCSTSLSLGAQPRLTCIPLIRLFYLRWACQLLVFLPKPVVHLVQDFSLDGASRAVKPQLPVGHPLLITPAKIPAVRHRAGPMSRLGSVHAELVGLPLTSWGPALNRSPRQMCQGTPASSDTHSRQLSPAEQAACSRR